MLETLLQITIASNGMIMARYPDQLAAWHGYPEKVCVDNGPEFTSGKFMQ